jgi:hypothetical protein
MAILLVTPQRGWRCLLTAPIVRHSSGSGCQEPPSRWWQASSRPRTGGSCSTTAGAISPETMPFPSTRPSCRCAPGCCHCRAASACRGAWPLLTSRPGIGKRCQPVPRHQPPPVQDLARSPVGALPRAGCRRHATARSRSRNRHFRAARCSVVDQRIGQHRMPRGSQWHLMAPSWDSHGPRRRQGPRHATSTSLPRGTLTINRRSPQAMPTAWCRYATAC